MTRALYESGPTDLRIWEVCEPMPGPYAPLYETEDEVGKDLVIFGRGLRRGEEISLDSPNGPEHRGWRAGEADFRLRWGLNVVSEVFDAAGVRQMAEDYRREGDQDRHVMFTHIVGIGRVMQMMLSGDPIVVPPTADPANFGVAVTSE